MAKLPEGRVPLSDEWFAKKSHSIESMQDARDFMVNTCPASRHVQIMAENLHKTGSDPMLQEDPAHCAESLASVVSSLYQARSFLIKLGYTWTSDAEGKVTWRPADNA